MSARVKFGEYELDVEGYELSRRGRTIKLERIPMELLLLLIKRSGELVSRDEIAAQLWGKGVFLDIDTSINTAIRKIRKALKDDAQHPVFVTTLTGKGYRFIAPMSVPPPPKPASAISAERVMLAVLPFENLSNNPDQDYFSDGLTEETISYLGRMNPARMGVIARTSSMAYKRANKSICQIGAELGVDYVLESSVRRENQQVRITSQLIQVKDQTHLWAATYDRDATGVLALQNELGREIAHRVQIELAPGATSVQTQDADAYDLYLRGRYYWNQLTRTGIERAIQYFQQAVETDPDYALAYTGLADCYAVLPITCDAPAVDVLPKATAAARRAIDLDDRLSEAHSAVGTIKMWMEWDWQGSETAFRRAIQLNSNYVTAHRFYGHLLSDIGRHRESAAEMERARRLDPLSPMIHALSGHLMYHARDYDQALHHLRNALAISSNLWVVHAFVARVYEQKGMLQEAIDSYQRAFDLSGGNTEAISGKGHILAKLGHVDEADQIIRVLKEWSTQKYVPPYNIAMVYAGLGDVQSALAYLEEAFATRDVRLTFLAVEPKWDFMRPHPQFQELLLRLGLPGLVKPL